MMLNLETFLYWALGAIGTILASIVASIRATGKRFTEAHSQLDTRAAAARDKIEAKLDATSEHLHGRVNRLTEHVEGRFVRNDIMEARIAAIEKHHDQRFDTLDKKADRTYDELVRLRDRLMRNEPKEH